MTCHVPRNVQACKKMAGSAWKSVIHGPRVKEGSQVICHMWGTLEGNRLSSTVPSCMSCDATETVRHVASVLKDPSGDVGLRTVVAAKAELAAALVEALKRLDSETQTPGAEANAREETRPEARSDVMLTVLAGLAAFLGNYSTREQFWAVGGPSTVTALMSHAEGAPSKCHVTSLTSQAGDGSVSCCVNCCHRDEVHRKLSKGLFQGKVHDRLSRNKDGQVGVQGSEENLMAGSGTFMFKLVEFRKGQCDSVDTECWCSRSVSCTSSVP